MRKLTIALILGSLSTLSTVPAMAGVKILTPDGAQPENMMRPADTAVQPIAAPPTQAQQTVDQTPSTQNMNASSASSTSTGAMSNNPSGKPAPLPPLPESKAFNNTLKSAMPLSAGQIAQLREAINANRRAAEAPLSPAQPRIETINARIGVGSPPSVSVQSGYVSTVNVVDA